jgi:hypothetical protein
MTPMLNCSACDFASEIAASLDSKKATAGNFAPHISDLVRLDDRTDNLLD